MTADIYPLQVLLLTVSGWVNRQQADVIAYLVEQNRMLSEQMQGRRLRLTDDQRRRLAAKAQILWREGPRQGRDDRDARHADALASRTTGS